MVWYKSGVDLQIIPVCIFCDAVVFRARAGYYFGYKNMSSKQTKENVLETFWRKL